LVGLIDGACNSFVLHSFAHDTATHSSKRQTKPKPHLHYTKPNQTKPQNRDAMGQLERRYGVSDAARRINDLAFIWISHMHADHHGGLYPLLCRRAAAGAPPLLIIGPIHLFRVLQAYSKVRGEGGQLCDCTACDIRGLPFHLKRALSTPNAHQHSTPTTNTLQNHKSKQVLPLSYTFLPASHFYDPPQGPAPRTPPQEALDALAAAKARLGLTQLEPFPVIHVSRSTGLQIAGSGGSGGGGSGSSGGSGGGCGGSGAAAAAAPWKVVFSGDTRPCPAVVEAARGATLLIHEATFEDELAADARAKRHSTLSEALGVAKEAGAYRTILTHFSSRYPKIPVLAQQQQQQAGGVADGGGEAAGVGGGEAGGSLISMVGESVAVGFDFMTVNLADLPWLPLVVPACDELLREEGFVTEEDEEGEGAGGD